MAADLDLGILGVAENAKSEQSATDKAMKECAEKGGKHCTVQANVTNSCMAMVVGNGTTNIQGASSKAEVESKALTECSSVDKACKVYYSSCSLPVLVN